MKVNYKKVIYMILLTIFFILVYQNVVEAASISSNIDAIDETKYPGYKAKIKELQATYPNIQVLYTGLDWNTVIENEHSKAHGRNLVETSLGTEWVCRECKANGELYDTGLYCASEGAIKYVIDPRNYLNTTDIFQFQKLNTAVGTDPTEIRKVLQMQKVTYLQDDEDAIKAFATVAKEKKLNAYFLITRVVQEQGKDGKSTLSSGKGYTGNGYTEYGKGYYNLFSIGATRQSTDPIYKVYINALDRAMSEKWNSKAASILGGGNFVGDSYINVGQNTLYLQKFDVYNTNGSLYWHQYMQNLFGAQNEAKILNSLYQVTGIQKSKNFEFIIPIYENMPKTAVTKPVTQYVGDINTDLKTMKISTNSAGREYIYGEILISEWIDGKAYTPEGLPKMVLKSTDGKYSSEMYVKHEGGLKYYYDRVIYNLDTNKQYYIEVTLTGSKNTGTKKTQKANINTGSIIGTFKDKNMTIQNNNIVFKTNGYVGDINTDLKTMKIATNSAGREYIYGELLIAEWINGNANTPKALPTMTLKSTDGTYSAGMYVRHDGGLKYYYDRVIYNLDTSKQYYIEVSLTSANNVGTKKTQNANINTGSTIGTFKCKNMQIQSNKIIFKGNEYIGEINTDLKTMKVGTNSAGREYIYGEILIAEWINKVANTPNGLPTMTLKSTDGTYSAGMYVRHEGGLKYYYDRVIYNLDTNKEYYIEVKLTNSNNISTKKTQNANMNIGKIGTFKNANINVKNNKIVFESTQPKAITTTTTKTVPINTTNTTNNTTSNNTTSNNATSNNATSNNTTSNNTTSNNATSNNTTKNETTKNVTANNVTTNNVTTSNETKNNVSTN